MTKPEFKVGDHITRKEGCRGLQEATVMNVDDKYYYLKILVGVGRLPIGAQVNYKLDETWNNK